MKKLGWWLLLTALLVAMVNGAGAECAHRNQGETETDVYYGTLDIDEHNAYWSEFAECLDCGEAVLIREWTEAEPHEWTWGSDGFWCFYCGCFENNVCQNCYVPIKVDTSKGKWHSHYTSLCSVEFAVNCTSCHPLERTHHLYWRFFYIPCQRCGEYRLIFNESIDMQPHDFDADGDCVDCGYHDASQAHKPLTVTLYPWDREVCVGEYIAATPNVSGGSGEYSFQWYASSDTGLSVSGMEGVTTKSACTWTFECTVKDTKTGQTVVAKSSPIKVREHEWENVTGVKKWNQCEDNRNYHYAVMMHTQVCALCHAEGKEVITSGYDEKHATIFEPHSFEGQNREFMGASLPFAKVLVCADCGYQQTQEDCYYNALLACVENGRNPMKDSAFCEELYRLYNTTEMGEEKIKALFECLEEAPETYRMVYLLSLGEYELVDYPGVVFHDGDTLELRFSFGNDRTNESFLDLFMHESGHGIEVASRQPPGKRTAFANHELALAIVSAMEKDIENTVRERLHELLQYYEEDRLTEDQIERIVQNFVNAEETTAFDKVPDALDGDGVMERYFRMVQNELCDELKGLKDSQGLMVSDVYGGMTNNKIIGDKGHRKENWPNYWYSESGKITYRQFMEGFAEYFSAYITSNGDAKRENLYYFQTAAPMMHDYVEYLESYYTNLLLERYGAIDAD